MRVNVLGLRLSAFRFPTNPFQESAPDGYGLLFKTQQLCHPHTVSSRTHCGSCQLPISLKSVCFSFYWQQRCHYALCEETPHPGKWSVQEKCVLVVSEKQGANSACFCGTSLFKILNKWFLTETPVEVSQLKFFPKLSNTCWGNYIRRLIVSLEHNISKNKELFTVPALYLILFLTALSLKKKKKSLETRTEGNHSFWAFSASLKKKVLRRGNMLRCLSPLRYHRTSERWEAELWELGLTCLTVKVLFLSK